MLGSVQLPNQFSRSPERKYSSNKVASSLKRVVEVRDEEVDTLLKGFAALFCILGSYFLLLPIRDEAGVSLGTKPCINCTGSWHSLCWAFTWHTRQRQYTLCLTVMDYQRVVRAAFFLWVSVVNLVGLSTMWARMADVFGRQLVGSLLATAWASALRTSGSRGQIVAPMLLSAAALEIAGRIASRLRRLSPVLPSPGKSRSPLGQTRQGQALRAQVWHSFVRLWEGFRCIAASRYLTHLSAYIVFTTVIASLMYFEKSMVVASAAGDAASRMALFGSINSASAFVIALLQLAATGRLLKLLGLATALTVSPAFAAALMLAIAVWPTPLVVASGEVVGYALARPAREVLFTVVPREEMYKAKICIDTLVVRGGDMLAAGLFHFLDGYYHLGPSGCAAAAFPICLGCCVLAFTLGRKQEALARPQAV
ncbi:hypothetical protein COCSUDRAFT_47078 [Coccomyxa subellipsoidea C-169]|uniref:ADP,ATP carrier protein n=1 Tax=Coccomyxa subellipsoidea (strain C-169) TaxID=574566 RepID=I0Z003_COCSC|nr:hypothetical protein COCSUDRAFT_47078 [Coccomyxa subellipsoidea C-169]EIE23972.1 hypothetical protein COCSUDRAFT_47078 [Coccomyxa subellipsoidea C-169]|eukprot:XP_005648516.1 hypothetical protein COCSUDRAFT_47078 [Coccomyxa subellipsoidea C-169]